jgi:hypothetical protein
LIIEVNKWRLSLKNIDYFESRYVKSASRAGPGTRLERGLIAENPVEAVTAGEFFCPPGGIANPCGGRSAAGQLRAIGL